MLSFETSKQVGLDVQLKVYAEKKSGTRTLSRDRRHIYIHIGVAIGRYEPEGGCPSRAHSYFFTMSTEIAAVQTPEMGKKKKSKGSTDTSVKKRKREEEVQANGESVTEPAAKKSKKPKKHKSNVAEEAQHIKGSGVPPATTPAPKDENASRKDHVTVTTSSLAETPLSAPKEMKNKKRKPSQDAIADSSAVKGASAKKPQQASQAVETPVSAPKEKKRRKPKVLREAAVESPAVGGALARKQKNPTDQQSTIAPAAAPDDILQSRSPFIQQTASFYLSLSPCANDFPLEGLCAEHISPLLLTYYPPLKGIVLLFSNPRLSEHPDDRQRTQASSNQEAKVVLARSIDEYAVTYIWLSAEFLIFRPKAGSYLEGYVNLQNESLLGLVCYNYFNAGIEWHRLPKDWRWVGDEGAVEGKGKQRVGQEAEGYWVDGDGKKVEGKLKFRVKDFEATPGSESGAGSINIHGTLLSEADDKALDDEERQRDLVSESRG